VNCSVRGANCRYTIHSPATEPLIATPLESFQTFPSPALSGMRALLHQMLIATQHSDQGPKKHCFLGDHPVCTLFRLERYDPGSAVHLGIFVSSTHLVEGIARARRRRRSVSVLTVPSFTCVSKLARHLAAACSQACFVGKPVFVSGAGLLGMLMTKVQLNNTGATG
jgi:hypothetical protein